MNVQILRRNSVLQPLEQLFVENASNNGPAEGPEHPDPDVVHLVGLAAVVVAVERRQGDGHARVEAACDEWKKKDSIGSEVPPLCVV